MSDPKDIAAKITELYPEIRQHDIGISVEEDPATGEWCVVMTHGKHSLSTHVTKQDADDCLSGKQCYELGVQIGRFVESYCLGQGECPVPAGEPRTA